MLDVIVIGMGAHGSAGLFHLAKKGLNVLGLEQFDQIHNNGSYHGLSRIIRMGLYEGDAYLPLAKRSFELWRELEKEYNEQILYMTGIINIGNKNSPIYKNTLNSAIKHNLEYTEMNNQEIMSKFPGFELPNDLNGVFLKEGGFLDPEKAVKAHTQLAIKNEAMINYNEKVLSWDDKISHIEVLTTKTTYKTKKLVIAGGAWNINLFDIPNLPLSVIRQVVAWFPSNNKSLFDKNNFPVWILDDGNNHGYGFPEYGNNGLKIGIFNHLNEKIHPDKYNKNITAEDIKILSDFSNNFKNTEKGENYEVCMFTNTPDGDFILDKHPSSENCIIVSCCSGHGFKFSSVIGEIISDLCNEGQTEYNIDLFNISRFN
jgi:sarcosine oxidase